jgi:hypothetical protein
MNETIRHQNDAEPLKLLKSSIVAYTKAKYWEIKITLFLSFLAIAYPIYYVFSKNENIKLTLFGCSFLLTILVQLFFTFFKGNTYKGALLKEKFDVLVLGLPKKTTTKDIDHAEISKLSLDYKGPQINNWYSQNLSVEIPRNISIAILQHSNSHWDIELRKKYRDWLAGFLIAYSIALFAFFVLLKVDGRTQFSIGFSILSFYTHFFTLIRGQSSVIEKRELISKKLDNVIRKVKDISIEELRDIQDEIFLTRQEPAKIPDFFFNLYKVKMVAQSEDYIESVNKIYSTD